LIEREAVAWRDRNAEVLHSGRREDFETSSGRPVEPVYSPEHLGPAFSYLEELGFPGEFPYTRGETPGGYRTELWGWEFYAGFGSAEDANKRYRYLLDQGSTGGVSIALDLPTQIGLDSDHPSAAREIGRVGVALNTLQDVIDLFEGISLAEAAKIFTTANCIAPVACAWFVCLAEARGEDPRDVVVTMQNDPMKEYVARGTQFLPVEPAVRLAVDVIEFCAGQELPWYPISVSGAHMKQAGGTCAEEAAFTLANAITYADELNAREVASFAPLMELHFCTDMDFFEEIAKYRVVRRLWAEILRDRYGVTGVPPRIHAATSGLPLTAQQPKNNIVRITLQALAQVLGGVAQTRTASYDEALAIPAEDAVKLSIRTNQILGYETGVADTVDPLGGSYYVESLTRSIYDEVRGILATVEDMGGAIRAVETGYFRDRLADGAYRQECQIQDRSRIVVGVNDFVEQADEDLKLFKHDPGVAERQLKKLRRYKDERDRDAVDCTLAALEKAMTEASNCMPFVIDAVRAGATLGEICDRFRTVFGEFQPQLVRIA
jgi:methylmalonyl-CoA mutase N-terminal domain/subunit